MYSSNSSGTAALWMTSILLSIIGVTTVLVLHQNSLNAKVENPVKIVKIADMEVGERGYAVSWGFKQSEDGQQFVAGTYNVADQPYGTMTVCIRREAAELFILCGGDSPEWRTVSPDWGWIPIDS